MKIVCLGTSHTFGTVNEVDESFFKTIPGSLQSYLKDNGIQTDIYNGGEGGTSIFSFPYKILNFYNEYKPDMFVIEVPDTDKVEIEITGDISNIYIDDQDDYHPIYSRQRVQTENWIKGEQYAWPYKKNLAKGECITLMHSNIAEHLNKYDDPTDIETNEHIRKTIEGLPPAEVENFFKKIGHLHKALRKNTKHFDLMVNYLYFTSLFTDNSDTDNTNYLTSLMSIINTLKSLDCKFIFWSQCTKRYLSNHLYKDTFSTHVNKPEYWVTGNIDWCFIEWAKTIAKEQNINHKEMKGDAVHYYPEWKKIFVEKVLGPEVQKIIKN